jgi:Fe-S-cluster containining protein
MTTEAMTSTALALLPQEQSIEFRRCTGHCCDPVVLPLSPGEIAGRKRVWDQEFMRYALTYIRWRPPEPGYSGIYEYRCRYFNREARECMIYGTGRRPDLCRRHPEYGYGLWAMCTHEGCTRRTMVVGGDTPIRWRFPDLWKEDRDRWCLFRPRRCEAVAAPDSGCEVWER